MNVMTVSGTFSETLSFGLKLIAKLQVTHQDNARFISKYYFHTFQNQTALIDYFVGCYITDLLESSHARNLRRKRTQFLSRLE